MKKIQWITIVHSHRAIVALVLAAAMGTIIWYGTRVQHVATAVAPHQTRPQMRFVIGERRTYRIQLTSKLFVAMLQPETPSAGTTNSPAPSSGVAPPTNPAESLMTCDADVITDVIASSAHESTVVFRFGEIRSIHMRMMGQEAVPMDRAHEFLHGRVAQVRFNPFGDIITVAYTQDPSPVFAALIQTLLSETQAVLGEGLTWERDESTTLAQLPTTFRWLGVPSIEDGQLAKTYHGIRSVRVALGHPIAAQESVGQYTIGMQQGRVARVTGSRSLRLDGNDHTSLLALDMQIDWQQVRLGKTPEKTRDALAAIDPATLTQRAIAQPIILEDAPGERLERRVAGMTQEEMFAGITTYAGSKGSPNNAAWFWRATGLLRQQPEMARDVAQRMANMPPKQYAHLALAADLLANAGTPQAQAALVDVLTRMQADHHPELPNLIQHVAMIPNPDPKTVDFVADQYEQSSDHLHLSAALTLGALTRRLMQHGYVGEAAGHVTTLARDLSSSRNAMETEVLVRALGNAAHVDGMGAILDKARDAQPTVRIAVAAALRRLQSSPAEDVLMTLMVDQHPGVQREALQTLMNYQLSHEHFARIDQAIADGKITVGAYNSVINLLTHWLIKQPDAVRRVLAAWQARQIPKGNFTSRLRQLSEQAALLPVH